MSSQLFFRELNHKLDYCIVAGRENHLRRKIRYSRLTFTKPVQSTVPDLDRKMPTATKLYFTVNEENGILIPHQPKGGIDMTLDFITMLSALKQQANQTVTEKGAASVFSLTGRVHDF